MGPSWAPGRQTPTMAAGATACSEALESPRLHCALSQTLKPGKETQLLHTHHQDALLLPQQGHF